MPMKRVRGRRLQSLRARLLRSEPRCRECLARGIHRPAVVLDHVVALINGGGNDEANLQGLCVECHRLKTARDLGRTERPTIGVDGYPAAS